MAKQLNVDLSFSANTQQAQKNIEDLSKSLNSIANLTPVEGMRLNKDLQAAVSSAQALQKHLNNAFNMKTGNFDLNRLSTSLKSANTDLATLTSGLLKAGIQGEQAFMKVQRALTTANVQINKGQSALAAFATSLKNTARWQLSSSVLHGLMSAYQQAMGYAKDLDKSLNDIRIVTGQNVDQMARFAKEANKAAQALSTTTTKYTNASLIYFQQGLNNEEVAERTEVTIKMANAAGVSAEKVSDQMTAVWNNFADGTKSLEYYADVMTALGAATASSTDEISEGLNKFAAVSKTVGLSYEYATSALATLTSNTRESADVVGTALKTLFARIQGLQLGETLEDGVDLNKYSEALDKVGIKVIDQNGQLKAMDNILDEMAAKWDTLNQAEQTALAQTVAGVRQYTQLVALMENWDNGDNDSMMANLRTTSEATGTLQEQADIYAESWEAAQKRVRASLEKIYSALIPEDFLIGLTSGTADVLNIIGDIINGMGGLRTILLMISSIALKSFGPALGNSLQSSIDKISRLQILSGGLGRIFTNIATPNFANVGNLEKNLQAVNISANNAQKQMSLFEQTLKNSSSEATKMSQSMINSALKTGLLTDEFKAYAGDIAKINNLQAMIEQSSKHLTSEQREQLQLLQEQALAASERHQQEVANQEILQQRADLLANSNDMSVYQGDGFSFAKNQVDLQYESGITATEKMKSNIKSMLEMWQTNHSVAKENIKAYNQVGNKIGFIVKNEEDFLQMNRDSLDIYRKTITLNTRINAIAKDTTATATERKEKIAAIVSEAQKEHIISNKTKDTYLKATQTLEEGKGITSDLTKAMQGAEGKAQAFAMAAGNGTQRLGEARSLGERLGLSFARVFDSATRVKTAIDQVGSALRNALSSSLNLGNTFVRLTQGISTVAMGMNSIFNAINTFKDDGATGMQKFTAASMAAVSGASALMAVLKGLNTLVTAHSSKLYLDTLAQQLNTKATIDDQAAELVSILISKNKIKTDEKGIILDQLKLDIKDKGLTATIAETAANYGLAASELAVLWPVLAVVAAMTALVAIILVAVKVYDALHESEKEAYEKAKQASEELTKAAEDAKNAADKLKESIEGYDSAVEKLEECTKGTQEWKDALEEVNSAALKVIDNLSGLSAEEIKALYDRDKETGQIVLNRDKVSEYQDRVDQKASDAEYAASVGKIFADQKKITLDTSDLADEIAAFQNMLSSEIESVQWIDNEALQKAITENLDDLQGLEFNEFKQKLEELGIETSYLTEKTLAEYQDRVNQLSSATEAAEEKLRLIASLKVDEILGEDYDAPTKDIVTGVLTDTEQQLKEDFYNLMISDSGDTTSLTDFTGSTGITQATKGNDNDVYNYIVKKLNEAGYNWTADTGNAVLGSDTNRRFIFRDENGDKTSEKSAEWIAGILASHEALSQLTGSAEQASDWLLALDKNTTESTASGIRQFITDENFNNLTQTEVDNLSSDIGTNHNDIIKNLKAAFGGIDDKELLSIFDANTLKEVSEKWLGAVGLANQNFIDLIDNMPNSVQDAFKNLPNTSSLSYETQKAISLMLEQAYQNGNLDNASLRLSSILSTMFEDPNVDATNLMNILSDIDWQTTNVSELESILNEAGIATDGFEDKLAELIYLMNSGESIGFDNAAQNYSTLQDFTDLKPGETITSEEQKILEQAGIDTSKYFDILANGTFELKENANEFYNIVNNKSLDGFKANIDALLGDISNQQNIVDKYQDDTDALGGNNINDQGNYDVNLVSDQLTFLEALDVDLENLENYKAAVANGENIAVEALNEIQNLVIENKDRWDELPSSIATSVEELNKHAQAVANSASSVDELNRLMDEGYISTEHYNTAIDRVMENEFEMEGLDPEIAEKIADSFEEMAEKEIEGYEALKDDAEAVKDATVRYMKLNEALEDIYDNYDDYCDIMKDLKKASKGYDRELLMTDESAKKLKTSMAGLLGTTEDMIDADFLATISPEDFEDAANGNAEAIERIRNEFIRMKAEMYGIGFDDLLAELNQFNDGAYIDLNNTPFLNKLIQSAVDAGATAGQIEAMLSGFGIDADVTPFTESLWAATQQASEAGQAIANATSFTTEVEQAPVENTETTEVPTFTENVTLRRKQAMNYVTMDDGFTRTQYPSFYVQAEKTVTTGVETSETSDTSTVSGQTVTNGEGKTGKGGVIIKNAHKATGGSKTPSTGNSNRPPVGGGGGGGGGGGSAPKPAEKVDVSKKSSFGERYHTINKQIDNMSREMERASKAADKLWSRQRLKYLEEQNKQLDREIELLQEKTRQAEEYLKQDKSDLDSTALDLGFTISYGADGEILNYDAIRDAYAQQMIDAQQYMNTLSTKDEQDAYNETVIEPLQKKIDAFEEAMDLYYNSLETIQENADLIQEKLDQKLQNNFDMWAGELELDIAINERDLELLEYYLGKIEDDVYQMAEAAALMVGSLDGLQSGNFGGQLGEYLSQLDTYNTKLEELNQKLAAGEITEAAYEEGLETIRSGLLDNLQAIQELDNAMLEYYSNTLDAVMEEMDKYTEKLEHQTSILEHYANMMEILGKSYDYRSMGEILEGQVKTLENELKVAEAEYDLYKSEAEEKRKLYEEAVAAGNVEAAEVYKKEWEAAEAAAMEAQSEMLDKTEAWAEAMRAVVENNLKGLAKTLEESLTGGTTFDQINLQLERAASLQEEYLTTTNKIYETNKLMRKAQQEIDKSSNTVAKQRLKDFIKETNQLQDKSKLSKYELEIQQAKYDLLLAQLTLEDAQNAKSTVRLQRDSEGNFGYVYTADQNKLAEAQQALEDAQNSLYNIGLEGANDYTEKYAETMQEMYDTLTSITEAYFNGEIASQEEYEAQMLAAQQYYYEQLENYQDLYGIALQTDTRVIKDAWSTGMQIMTIETSDWKNAVKEYTNDATKALVDWYAQVDAIANKTGLDNIANKVKQITDESDKLKDKILGTNGEPGVIQALADELTAVSNLTGGYANLRATLQGLIEDYEELMRTVIEAQNTETPIDSDTPNDNPDVPETEVPDTEDPTPENPEDTDPATTNPEDVDAPILKKGDSVTVKSTATHFSRNGGNGTRMRSFVPGSTYSVMDFDDDEVMIGRNGVVTGWVKKTDLVGFNTGGYTGSWGPYGKLAILDEKELVLNQGDTANFLASMEVLERILEMLDVQSASAQLGGLLSTPIFGGNNTSSSVEQNVHIEASFPSVTDRNEIEEAFNNLINTASQYANRKI